MFVLKLSGIQKKDIKSFAIRAIAFKDFRTMGKNQIPKSLIDFESWPREENYPQIFKHTQHTLISVSFGVVNFCSLRGEGKRGWEGRVKNGVIMKHMITLE